jgi:hypothetical protein
MEESTVTSSSIQTNPAFLIPPFETHEMVACSSGRRGWSGLNLPLDNDSDSLEGRGANDHWSSHAGAISRVVGAVR